jgi:Zn-dependent protease
MPSLYIASTWVIPLLLAITFHEAAHGFVAKLLGDDTAWRQGRVSFSPFRHIDLFGTILMPAMLLLAHAPFLFGYAKPVPVDFRNLKPQRLGSVLVAAAGPATNLILAVAAALALHGVTLLPDPYNAWVGRNLANALVINVMLAVFNLLPLPPLDGGRIAVGLLPAFLARPLAGLERYGMLILVTLLILLPLIGAQMGQRLDFLQQLLTVPARALVQAILTLTGHTS